MIKEEINGRVIYSFPEEECEVPIIHVYESLFIEHFMKEGWSEEDCVSVIGGLDGNVNCRLSEAWETWYAAWEHFKINFNIS